jgi:hypothetical protein
MTAALAGERLPDLTLEAAVGMALRDNAEL